MIFRDQTLNPVIKLVLIEKIDKILKKVYDHINKTP